MVLILNEEDYNIIDKIKDSIIPSIEYDTFYHDIVTEVFDEKFLLPDEIMNLGNEIKNVRLSESAGDKGPDYVAAALGVSKRAAIGMMQNPKNAARVFRALREKLEECEDQEMRAKAERKGFLATVIYTIKKAIAWIVKTFQDLKDYVLDSAIDSRREGAAQAKRDYKWINKYGERYMDKTFGWYNDADQNIPRMDNSPNYPQSYLYDKAFDKLARFADSHR